MSFDIIARLRFRKSKSFVKFSKSKPIKDNGVKGIIMNEAAIGYKIKCKRKIPIVGGCANVHRCHDGAET